MRLLFSGGLAEKYSIIQQQLLQICLTAGRGRFVPSLNEVSPLRLTSAHGHVSGGVRLSTSGETSTLVENLSYSG